LKMATLNANLCAPGSQYCTEWKYLPEMLKELLKLGVSIK